MTQPAQLLHVHGQVAHTPSLGNMASDYVDNLPGMSPEARAAFLRHLTLFGRAVVLAERRKPFDLRDDANGAGGRKKSW